MRTTDDLILIARNGGSMDFDAGARATEDLVQIVRNASAKSTIIVRGLGGRSTNDLVQISRNSAGCVILVVD